MVNTEGKAVLIDFGSSMLLKSGLADVSQSHDDSPGTPRWMAPEALRPGRYPITQKVDVWSFACLCIEVSKFVLVLLYTLTGKTGLLWKEAFQPHYQRWSCCD